MNRRTFLWQTTRYSVGISLAAAFPSLLAACGDDEAPATQAQSPLTATPDQAQAEARKLVGDVIDFRILNDRGWQWPGGWITMRLHAAFFNGQKVYHIRTDASDREFAEQEELVFVPKLAGAMSGNYYGEIYLIDKGASAQIPVVSTAPGQPDFTPLLRINRAVWDGTPELLDSVDKVKQAAGAGKLKVETTQVIVNYPFVKWPGGELPVDTVFENALGGGPLVSAPDLDAMTVTCKLHQCYPESYYIITDTGAVPMAGMMNVVGAPSATELVKAGATEKIYVFGNGVSGFAAMGFQPSIFASKAGDPAWSPMWEHITVMWKQGKTPAVLTSEQEVLDREKAGDVELFPGTPATGGQSFVVNCPAPIIAPNTFRAV